MRCPHKNCNAKKSGIIDSRSSEDDTMKKRRHQCPRGHRFTTYETYATSDIWQRDERFDEFRRLAEQLGPVLAFFTRKQERLKDRSLLQDGRDAQGRFK